MAHRYPVRRPMRRPRRRAGGIVEKERGSPPYVGTRLSFITGQVRVERATM